MTKIINISKSPSMQRLLAALEREGPLNTKDWAYAASVDKMTVHAYVRQMIEAGLVHVVRIDEDHRGHLVLRVYGIGAKPGTHVPPEPPKWIPPTQEFIPLPVMPMPDPITAALMGMSVGI